MLSGLLEPAAQMPRSQKFWMVSGGLIVAQLLAFWVLCSHQVRIAEARQAQQTVQQLALADCLQYIPGATIATCNSRIAQMGLPPAGEPAPGTRPAITVGAQRAPATGAMPVSFSR